MERFARTKQVLSPHSRVAPSVRTRSKPLSHSPRPLQTKKKMKTQLNFDEMSVALFAKWQARAATERPSRQITASEAR
jgi:hypothetical protein